VWLRTAAGDIRAADAQPAASLRIAVQGGALAAGVLAGLPLLAAVLAGYQPHGHDGAAALDAADRPPGQTKTRKTFFLLFTENCETKTPENFKVNDMFVHTRTGTVPYVQWTAILHGHILFNYRYR